MNVIAMRPLALAACLVAATACSRQSAPAPQPADSEPSAVSGLVAGAIAKARKELATQNIDVGSGKKNRGLPRAQISPQGDLLIEGRKVVIDERQRALLLAYRGEIVALAEAGMAIGMQGADLGIKAASEALRGVLSGNTDDIEKRVEAEARKVEAEAMKLCVRLPSLLKSQQALAAALPEFAPYATMDQSDVEDCRTDFAEGGPRSTRAGKTSSGDAKDDGMNAAERADAAAAE